MRRIAFVALALLFALVMSGCTEDRTSPATPDTAPLAPSAYSPEAMAAQLALGFDWIVDGTAPEEGAPVVSALDHQNLITDFEREVIAGNIVHYSAVIETGPGPYDRIGIHRVVRETRPYRPVWSPKALFLLHGDLKNFEGMWIPGQYSPNLPDDFGLAVYLARQGIDVWGMDQSWNFIPQEETDFSFFQGWGLQKEADHLSIGLAVARNARAFSGHKLEKILLLGYSSGAMTGFSLLNQESQLPLGHRQVKGFISADLAMKTNDPSFQEFMCARAASYEALYDAHQYQDPLPLRLFAYLARTAPDDQSPFGPPGMTNLQFVLLLGGGQVFGATTIHYHAPIIENGLPAGFQHITIDQWLDFLENTASYQPVLSSLEWAQLLCGQVDLPYDDYLSQVIVPVFDIGAAGGFAPYTAYTMSLLGSTDITQTYISVGAPEPALDYGHIDIFTAHNAPDLVWDPIARWVIQHSNEGHGGHGHGCEMPAEIAVGE